MGASKLVLMLSLPFALVISSCTRYASDVQTVMPQQEVKSPVLAADTVRHLKRKVAIARFSNETKYAKGFFTDQNTPDVGKQAMDILSAKLAATGKFILLERSDIDEINKELSMNALGGLKIPADQLIVGSVTEFGRKTTGEVGVLSRSKRQTATAKVHVRLINVNTGEVVFGEEGSGEAFSEVGSVMGIGGRAGYDAEIDDRAIEAAISKLVHNLIGKLLDSPWKSYILDHQNGSYIISGGKSQGINAGDLFNVMRKGKTVTNPQTGMPLTFPGVKVGTIKVVSIMGATAAEEVSFCEKVTGDIPTQGFDEMFVEENK
jgi:curli biogenesis system outer membrane secretion channel CsgG